MGAGSTAAASKSESDRLEEERPLRRVLKLGLDQDLILRVERVRLRLHRERILHLRHDKGTLTSPMPHRSSHQAREP
eukprot:1845371-Pleurochrysis_carterae.AAC.3